jgi:hypothetical protein
MSSSNYLLAVGFRRNLSILALVVCVFAGADSGRAQTVNAALTNNGSSTLTITQNETFTLTLTLNMNFLSQGVTFFLQSNLAGSGYFRIVDRTGGGPWVIPPLPLDCLLGDACLLNPTVDIDLGATTPNPLPAGNYTFATFTFTTANAPPGQYFIMTDRGIVTDRTGGQFNDVPFSAVATINVVPEPGAVTLALFGGAAMLVALRRRGR